MDDQQFEIEPESEVSQAKEKLDLWEWYFSWHPRVLFTVPIFLLFAYSGLWLIWAEFHDVVSIFQGTPVTWISVFLVIIFGSFILMLLGIPVWICFASISWLHEINVSEYTAWKKFLYSLGIILLVVIGASLLRLLVVGFLNMIV